MQSLVVPVLAAIGFTLGGYAIVRAERYAEVVAEVLGVTFLLCALATPMALLVHFVGVGALVPVTAAQAAASPLTIDGVPVGWPPLR